MSDWLPRIDATYDRDLELSADACVIGTGAGGAVLASELAEGGRSVVMLDKGGYHTRRDFNQREQAMMPLLFEDAGARTTKDGAITVLQGKTVGGGTTVNWAICFDPPELVLARWASEHGVEGLSPADLRPSLDKVRFVLNVHKMTPGEITLNSRLLLEGAEKLGLKGDRFEHNRTQCLQSGFCTLGCAYDRKQSMLVTYVPRALHFGARLLPNAEATEFDLEGDRVTAVRGVVTDPRSGARHRFRIRAKLFSVSGGAIGTPQLLLKNGLANQSGRLGKNLALHPTAAAVGIFPHEVRGYQGIHYGTYVSSLEAEGILIEAVFAYPGLMGANLYAWGAESERVMRRYNDMAAAIVLLRDDGSGQVTVNGHGVPVLDYALTPRDQERFRRGLKTLARIYLAAGAEEVLVPHSSGLRIRAESDLGRLDRMAIEPCRMALFSAHQMGTAAMGGDPATSVTDSYGRCHGYDNLFVCDSSLFPTALGVNPQITIAALADRTARHLLREADRYFA